MTTAAPPQAPRFQRLLALAALVALAAASVSFPADSLVVRGGPVVVGLALAVVGLVRPGPGGAIAVLAFGLEALVLAQIAWQLIMLAALALLFGVSRVRRAMPSVSVPRGHVPGWPTFACAAVTPLFLLGWLELLDPDVADITRMVPAVSPVLLVLGGLGFAVVNALFEEWIWRGVIQARLADLFPVSLAIAIQAASFGLAHAHGFPRGVVGVVLAGTWAVMLGVLRSRSRGILAPVTAHFVADLTIALLVIFRLR